ncbi:MAG: RNA polymerase sigma factor, partial [Acidimicrobiales bacterium]
MTDSGRSGMLPTANKGAFDAVLAAHGAVAWGLAQAISTDMDMARRVAREGLVRAARQAGSRPTAVPRGVVLAGVWSSASELLSEGGGGRTIGAGHADATLAAQYSTLPERWRASIWLSAVVGCDYTDMGAILGVPPSFAAALVRRSTEALRGRMESAGAALPARVGPALAPLAGDTPADLGAEIVGPLPRSAPAPTVALPRSAPAPTVAAAPVAPAPPLATDTGSMPALIGGAAGVGAGAAMGGPTAEGEGRKSRSERRADKADKADADKVAKTEKAEAAKAAKATKGARIDAPTAAAAAVPVGSDLLGDDPFAPPRNPARRGRSARKAEPVAMAEVGALEGAEFWGEKPGKAPKPPKEPREPKPPRERRSRREDKVTGEFAIAGAGAGGLFLEDPGPGGPLLTEEKHHRMGRPIGVGLL